MRDLKFSDRVLTFDGDVVEIFGGPRHGSARFHVELVEIVWNEPAPDGSASFGVRSTPDGVTETIDVPAGDLDAVNAFIKSVQVAVATRQGRFGT